MSSTDDTYVALDQTSVRQLVADTPSLSGVVGPGEITADEIGDGNLNAVFVLRSVEESGRSLLIKQALPYLRVAGAGWPLTRERMRFETQSLLLYNELTPDLAPNVFDHDDAQSWVAMECLDHHRVMRHGVIDGDLPPDIGQDLGRFMATLTYRTSEMSLSAPEKRRQVTRYTNPALCELQEQFVYTNPFFDSEDNEPNPVLAGDIAAIRADADLKVAIAATKAQYMSSTQALLHGDLHTGSVMVRSAEDPTTRPVTKIIDPEFAFYGPVGYDVGTLLANLCIAILAQPALAEDPQSAAARQTTVTTVLVESWNAFVQELKELWTVESPGDLATTAFWADSPQGFPRWRDRVINQIAIDAARHGGCELLRRCLGIVSVAELQAIDDLDVRARVERSVMRLARRWLLDDPPRLDIHPTHAIDHLLAPLSDELHPVRTE